MYNKLAKDMDKTHQNLFDRKKIIGNKAMLGSAMTIQRVRILDADVLSRNIVEDTGDRRPANSQAHHIIPNELVVEGIDAVTGGLINGSFLGVIDFFDQAWNGVFLGTYRSIDGLPMHKTSHPEYTAAVKNYIGERIGDLVTDSAYAQEVAERFRGKLSDYYEGGVADISASSTFSKGVSKYYEDIGFGYLNNMYRELSGPDRDDFCAAVVRGGRFTRSKISPRNLYDLGFALEHGGVASADTVIDLSRFRSQMEVE